MKHPFFIIPLFLLVAVTSFAQQTVEVSAGNYSSNKGKPAPKTCKNGRVITPQALTLARIPTFGGADHLPAECQARLAGMKKKWMDEDYADWSKLSNQFCSHEEGWIEINPGTCQAGGPPPVCTANHWIQDPKNAKDIWNKQQKAIRSQREAELKEAMCECWTANVKKQMDKEKYEMLQSYKVKNDFNIPCGNGCPPGYTCSNGFCQEENPAINIGKEVWDKGNAVLSTKKFAKYGLKVEQLIGKFSSVASKLYNLRYLNPVISNAFDLLTPAEIGTWAQAYFRSSDRLSQGMNKTYSLVQELLSAKNHINPCYCRDPDLVYQELLKEKQQLLVEFESFNIAFGGIKRERELDKTSCAGIYDVYHQELCEYFTFINNIPLPDPR